MILTKVTKQLIHHTINNFNIAPDKIAISRVQDSLSTLKQARELRIRDAESSLKSTSSLKHMRSFSDHPTLAPFPFGIEQIAGFHKRTTIPPIHSLNRNIVFLLHFLLRHGPETSSAVLTTRPSFSSFLCRTLAHAQHAPQPARGARVDALVVGARERDLAARHAEVPDREGGVGPGDGGGAAVVAAGGPGGAAPGARDAGGRGRGRRAPPRPRRRRGPAAPQGLPQPGHRARAGREGRQRQRGRRRQRRVRQGRRAERSPRRRPRRQPG